MRTGKACCCLLLVCSVSGCMSPRDMAIEAHDQLSSAGVLDYSQVQRSVPFRIQTDSFIYIAQGPFMPIGKANPPPNIVADISFDKFIQYFPLVRRASQPLGLDEAMMEARALGAHYLLYTRFAAADDRINTLDQWLDQGDMSRLGIDSSVVQLMLIEVGTRALIDTVNIRSHGGLLTFYNENPEDLLGAPLRQYAQRLAGLQ
jgi:hypothetical protein